MALEAQVAVVNESLSDKSDTENPEPEPTDEQQPPDETDSDEGQGACEGTEDKDAQIALLKGQLLATEKMIELYESNDDTIELRRMDMMLMGGACCIIASFMVYFKLA